MKRSKSLLIITFLISSALLWGCDSKTKETKLEDNNHTSNIDSTQTQDISIIKLISNPEIHQGKKVRVIGYLNLEFEGNAVYLNKEDYLSNISKNALWLELTRNDLHNKSLKDDNNKYVIIEGTFNTKQGHESGFSGSITNITRLEIWDTKK